MMKKIILMSIAAMILTSCAKDSMKEANKGRAIDFRVAAQSRATETTTANLTTFYVTAIDESGSNYFTNVAFTKVDEYFSSSPVYYWPGSGSLNFFAYAPSATTLGATVTINNTTKTLAGFSPAAEITDQKDFVTASASGSKADETSGVALTFDHQLSQIEVKARNANEGYVYQIKGVRFAQPVAKADFDFATSEWTLSTDAADKAVYDVTYNNVVTLNTFAQNIMKSEGDNAMLIPQQLVAWDAENDQTNANKGAYLSVYAKVTTADGAKVYPKADGMEYAWLAVPVDTKWEAGYKYVYTLDFTSGAGYPDPLGGDPTGSTALGGPIKFTMDVNPWTEKSAYENKYELINGKWQGLKAIVIDADDQSERYITEEEELKDWLNNYYNVEFQDCCRMFVDVEGEIAETQLTIAEDGNMYMEMLNIDGEYFSVPHIEYLDQDELILKIVYTHETQIIYFQKNN